MRPRTAAAGLLAAALGAVGVWMRVRNALHYPPDWGFDGPFNWRYIHRLTQDGTLPPPAAGWSTADPPLFFATAALLLEAAERAAGRAWHEIAWTPLLPPLFNTAAGLGVVAIAAALARGAVGGDARRALLAAGLLLFLPAHIAMSVMVSEEMLAALLVSLALLFLLRPAARPPGAGRALAAGLAGGLAALTKLSGALVVPVVAAVLAMDGWRRGEPRRALLRAGAAGLVALLCAGWFYERNRELTGSPVPFGLPAHAGMFDQPPGERSLLDYVRLPLATWTDPQLLDPDLLHSVWGSTLATLWFDGHRYFLPRDDEGVRLLGTATLTLALLPTAAFLLGLARGARRARRAGSRDDAALVLLVVVTLAGFAAYTWRNPWFTVVKGTSLLGLCVPFAYYASEVLADWTRRRAPTGPVVWTLLAALAACAVLASTFDLAFVKTEVSGLPWREGAP